MFVTPMEYDVMSNEPSIDWTGASGKKYRHWIYPLTTSFKAMPGSYIFAKEISPRRWSPVYIGETINLSERFDNHHRMACVKENGATHIHVHVNKGGQKARQAEEADLIKRWNPPCNG
jgi:hypothetical protein